jgi:hypothetical protein
MSLSLILSWIYLFGQLVLAGLAVWTRINKRHPNTAGYVSNATKFTTWLFFLAIIGFILLLIWNAVSDEFKMPVMNNGNYWLTIPICIVLYICYYIIAFKPVTAEELETIKSKNGRIVEFSGSLATGLLGALAGMGAGFVAIVLEVLNPWVLIKQVGNTLTYAAKGTMGFVTSFIAGAFVILAVLVIVLWGAFFLPIIGMFVLPACGIIRFLINSYKYKDGPKTI